MSKVTVRYAHNPLANTRIFTAKYEFVREDNGKFLNKNMLASKICYRSTSIEDMDHYFLYF